MALPLRRLPVPRCEPPYDDLPAGQQQPDGSSGQGVLALAFVLPSGVPAEPEVPRLQLVRPDDATADPVFAEQATPRAALPTPHPWAGRFVQALVEVLAGARPPAQLVRWTSEEVYGEVQQQLRRSRHRTSRPGMRACVRSLHVSEPADGVAEVCALVQRGTRATAVAVRLEGLDGRWKCTALALP